ncbi:MAG: glycosyltransferase family 1 protein [Bacteroidetes bacterium]|nr:MAG: glycosyltransferase family 1 protein [Bacteroidota bacterium]
MKVDIIFPEFFTWTWNYSYGLVDAADQLGVLNQYINLGFATDRDIYELGDTSADAIIFVGGCEHSSILHDSPAKRELLKNIKAKKLAIVVESFEYDMYDKKQFPDIERHGEETYKNAELFTHIVSSDEKDVDNLKTAFPYLDIAWMPQCVDIDMFTPREVSNRKGCCFIGSLYKKRRSVLERFNGCGIDVAVMSNVGVPFLNYRIWKSLKKRFDKIFLQRKIERKYKKISETIYKKRKYFNTRTLNNIYNKFLFNVNLPGPHKGFTSRVFEILSAGGVLCQPFPKGRDKTASLFNDMEHLIYYDVDNFHEFVEKFQALSRNKKKLQDISYNGIELVRKKHSCLVRMEQLIDFLKNGAV